MPDYSIDTLTILLGSRTVFIRTQDFCLYLIIGMVELTASSVEDTMEELKSLTSSLAISSVIKIGPLKISMYFGDSKIKLE